MAIYFSNADIDFSLNDEPLLKKWIAQVVKNHSMRVGKINYLFCSDEYVYDANVKFLNHDTYTDIITFDTVEGDSVSGDIMIMSGSGKSPGSGRAPLRSTVLS